MRTLLAPLLLLPLFSACRRTEPPPPAPVVTQADRDRQELVLQARRDWKPEIAGRKLTIALISEKSSIRRGEPFRYRLEVRSVGAGKVAMAEASPSFIKDGVLCGDHGWSFSAVLPGGERRVLPCAPLPPSGPPASSAGVAIELNPGDYLLTRRESPSTPFRSLLTSFAFTRLGTYRLRAEYAGGGLRARSEPVTLTVVR